MYEPEPEPACTDLSLGMKPFCVSEPENKHKDNKTRFMFVTLTEEKQMKRMTASEKLTST